ncbi:MAG TPA: DUF4354 domain-containing protein [Erwinia persicina]|uniref:DUF4354 family protein n=1 Tax=Erwinia persicina TaxID=55211 RepID=UPI0007891CC2|nr:DUF4354 family protein [Erwinia persicina]MBC3944559.1 DUF4354 family protein [Erwinia persicina]MBD8168232.1 DUF4354 family protein [Erwinia persicina]MCQ4094186.1 DUF4354 family protein [Erwinia persicina]MCQ4100975.1 DUF4354 family protein [Erwinia persicina]QZQ49646.1 DUF4354 family protein [Erwinia persicina]
MKWNALLATIAAASLTFSAATLAADVSGITVYATQKEMKSRSAGDLNNYGKTFDVTLENTTSTAVDLKRYCLKGYTSDNRVFPVDRVATHLASGKLKPLGKVSGLVIFSAADDSVFNIDQVKISDTCK